MTPWHCKSSLGADPVILLSSGLQMSGTLVLCRSWMHLLAFPMPADHIHESCLIHFSPQVVRNLETMCHISEPIKLNKDTQPTFRSRTLPSGCPGFGTLAADNLV